jgi:hypothetical protein
MTWGDPAGVFVIEPFRASQEVDRLVRLAKEKSDEMGLDLRARKAECISIAGGSRRAEVLSPDDAGGLYKRLHLTPTLVLCFRAVFVRRDPSRNPPTKRDAISLKRFVDYKSMFCLAQERRGLLAAFDRFSSWRSEVFCDGEGDPRILPFHIFATVTHPDRLADREGASAFNAAYGPAAERIDAKERIWTRASRTAYHGRDDCFVAGELLPEGMHWDVSGFGRGAILTNAARVWKVKDPRSYLNIYPDGHVRPPNRRGVSKVWPRKT